MNPLDIPPARARRYAITLSIVLLFAPLGYSLAAFAISPRAEPLLEMPTGGQTECLTHTTYMRFHHMDYLKELRDAGVREGERREISFLTCIDCHTSRATFCDRCHDAVSLSPDCFGCHYYP